MFVNDILIFQGQFTRHFYEFFKLSEILSSVFEHFLNLNR